MEVLQLRTSYEICFGFKSAFNPTSICKFWLRFKLAVWLLLWVRLWSSMRHTNASRLTSYWTMDSSCNILTGIRSYWCVTGGVRYWTSDSFCNTLTGIRHTGASQALPHFGYWASDWRSRSSNIGETSKWREMGNLATWYRYTGTVLKLSWDSVQHCSDMKRSIW